MSVISMKQLLEAGVHFGHQTRRWNPKMARYIFAERNGIYIIDLQKTVKKAEEAEMALLSLQERKEVLEADIAVLEQDLPVLHDQIDEAQEELQLLNEAIREKNHEGERRLGMDEWMRRVAEKKAESQDKAELNLLRRFVAEMPGVKALWQQFMQLIKAQREREKRKYRKQPNRDGH